MKRVAVIFVVVGLATFAVQFQIYGRGGGGGGRGGGGGGGARAGGGGGGFSPSAGRAPSMAARPSAPAARPSTGVASARPAGGAPGPRPGTGAPGVGTGGPRPAAGAGNVAGAGRPSSGQLNKFLDIPGAGGGAAVAGGAARPGGAAADFLQQGAGVAQLPAAGSRPAAAGAIAAAPGVGRPGVGATGVGAPGVGRPGTPGQNLAQNRPNRIENRGQRQGDRQQRRDEVRNQFQEHNPGNFWQENPGWAAMRITRPYRWATWAAVGGWCGYTEAVPYSYGENVYYTDDQVYQGDQPVATADEYAQQAEAIATTAPTTAADKAEWLALGVFAITQDGQASGTAPSLYMQLAISKEGIISGTLKNTSTDKVQSLEGAADKKSQRAAWAVSGQQRPIMETGLSNLTQDAAPALIHFADGQTQQWLMVRMPEDATPPKP
jgi:hypothetical protein